MHRQHEGDGEVMGKSAISSTENGQEADPPEGDGEVMRKSAISSTENGQEADPPEGDGEVMRKSAISSTENGQEADPPEGDGEVMRKSAISSTENGQEADSPVIPQEIKDRWEREQIELKQLMILEDSPEITKWISCCNHGNTSHDFFIGGVDISFVKGDNENACAALIVLNFPQLEVVYADCEMIKLTAPYIPGFLAFREASFLLDMYNKLRRTHPQFIPQVDNIQLMTFDEVNTRIDQPMEHDIHQGIRGEYHVPWVDQSLYSPKLKVIMVDGNGLLHPREFGLACHLGVLIDTPCIGVAKKLFQVDGLENNEEHHLKIGELKQGGDTFSLIGTTGKILGKALRSCDSTSNPVYISTGHRVTLNSAVELVHKCCKHRVPEPTRQADIKSREYLRDNFIKGQEEQKNKGQKKQKTKMKYAEKTKEETMNKCKPINNVEELFESSGSLFDEDNT